MDGFEPFASPEGRDKYTREATLAWLDEHLSTLDARSLGRGLFLAQIDQRANRSTEGLSSLNDVLEEARDTEEDVDKDQIAEDSVFLGVHLYAAQAHVWLGANAWPNAIMTHASIPILDKLDVARAMLRGVRPQVITVEEVSDIIDAFVSATWGERVSPKGFEGRVDEFAISSPAQFGALQYAIGILWGFAMRNLVLRYTLDHSMGSVPETAASARRRLEQQFSRVEGSIRTRSSLLQYANDFFGHQEWAGLCRPSDATLRVLEHELEEILPSLALLAGYNESDLASDESVSVQILGRSMLELELTDDETAEQVPLDEMVTLSLDEWEGFTRRAVTVGALLADAEAFVDSRIGSLARGQRLSSQWAFDLIRNGVLSGLRHEQGSMTTSRLQHPIQRLATVLRTDFLASKLRTARAGLENVFADELARREEEEGNATSAGSEVTK